MSLKKHAKRIQQAGFKNSGEDSVLAHITPQEASLLQMFGGSGRRDPKTGLPHFDEGYGGPGGGGSGYGGGYGGYGYGAGGYGGGDGGGGFGGDGEYGGTGTVGYGDSSGPGLAGDGGLSNWGLGPGGEHQAPTAADWGNEGGNFGDNYGLEGIHYGDPSFALSNSPVNSSPEVSWSDTWWGRQLKSMLAAKLGPAGTVANMAHNLATSKNPGQTAVNNFGGVVGGVLGGALAGPVGAIGGSMLGGKFGQGFSGGDASAAGNSRGTGSSGWGELGAGLYGLYKGNQAGKSAGTLSNLYGQNSPYAQYLRTSLERRDAAAGRRSQYGPREVELQAKLADMYSRNYPMMAQAQGQRDQLYGQGLGLLFRGADKLGYIDKAADWASGLFNGGDAGYSWAQPQTSETLSNLFSDIGYGG